MVTGKERVAREGASRYEPPAFSFPLSAFRTGPKAKSGKLIADS